MTEPTLSGSTDERMVPCAPPLTIPVRHYPSMVFTSWRAAIVDAHMGIEAAREHRRRTFRAAADAGMTRREIGEAAGLSAAAVQKIIGKDKRTSLDSPVTS